MGERGRGLAEDGEESFWTELHEVLLRGGTHAVSEARAALDIVQVVESLRWRYICS